jgi:hypothetical protein
VLDRQDTRVDLLLVAERRLEPTQDDQCAVAALTARVQLRAVQPVAKLVVCWRSRKTAENWTGAVT